MSGTRAVRPIALAVLSAAWAIYLLAALLAIPSLTLVSAISWAVSAAVAIAFLAVAYRAYSSGQTLTANVFLISAIVYGALRYIADADWYAGVLSELQRGSLLSTTSFMWHAAPLDVVASLAINAVGPCLAFAALLISIAFAGRADVGS